MAVAHAGVVTLDCADPSALGEFWARMLEGEVVYRTEATLLVRASWIVIAAMRVEGYEAPTWPEPLRPKQIHLDLAVTDLAAAVVEALACGAVEPAIQPAPDARRILFDPAGHPFCLTTQVPPAVFG